MGGGENVTAKQILEIVLQFAGDNWGWGLAIILSIVEVSKIKINPWSALFKWIGNILFSSIRLEMASMKTDMTKEMSGVKSEVEAVKTEVFDVKKDLGEMKDESREDKAKAARTRILVCADEVYQGTRHSKEYFDNILSDITFYKIYCKEHPDFQNDMTVLAVERIEEVYRHCLEEHDFL